VAKLTSGFGSASASGQRILDNAFPRLTFLHPTCVTRSRLGTPSTHGRIDVVLAGVEIGKVLARAVALDAVGEAVGLVPVERVGGEAVFAGEEGHGEEGGWVIEQVEQWGWGVARSPCVVFTVRGRREVEVTSQ
jgi:hypothetical protein